MYFLMICHHNAGVDALRDQLRPAHRAWVASGGNGLAVVLTGAALWNDAGDSIGNFGILQAQSTQAAHDFAKGDPFAMGGIVNSIKITRLADTFQAERIDPLSRS